MWRLLAFNDFWTSGLNYLEQVMDFCTFAAKTGWPKIRPLFLSFSNQRECRKSWNILENYKLSSLIETGMICKLLRQERDEDLRENARSQRKISFQYGVLLTATWMPLERARLKLRSLPHFGKWRWQNAASTYKVPFAKRRRRSNQMPSLIFFTADACVFSINLPLAHL